MTLNKRGGLVLHGISGLAERKGYSAPFKRNLLAWARPLLDGETPWDVDLAELIWEDLADDLAPDVADLPAMPELVADYLLDVITYARHGEAIRAHVERQIEQAGPGRPLLAHSLGSVIACDLVTQWAAEGAFERDPEAWPIRGLVTIGSPLGINVPFMSGLGFLDRAGRLERLFSESFRLPSPWRWLNIHDPNDVVVQGALSAATMGKPAPDLSAMPGYQRLNVEHLAPINSGGILSSHGGYWTHNAVAQAFLELLTA